MQIEMWEEGEDDSLDEEDDVNRSYLPGCLCRTVIMIAGSITFMGVLGMFWILETSVKEDQYLA